MKPTSFLIMLSVSLCASLCCSEPDEGINYQVEKENLISVENNADTFNLNETITIETTIEDDQVTVSSGDLLLSSLFYDDSLDTSFFQHSITLYKETGFGTLSPITVTIDDITTSNGITETNGNSIQVRSIYDSNTNTFKNKFSITLRETGTFFLSDNRFGFDDFSGIFISGGVFQLGFVQIKTSILNANSDGGYRFVVN